MEQLIDGSLVSIGSPMVSFLDVAAGPDGSFYLAAQDYGSGEAVGKIFRYTYHEDVSAVPSTELDVYMLTDDAFMQQAATLFQKKYPDIYVNLQTGMTGDNAVTETDAIKTLNTEIMAGNGPDVMILDGLPDSTYVERGMLTDISGIIKDAGLLENIKSAYEEEDGSIYRMPTRFAMPLIFGKEEDLEKVTDLTTLADVVESHKAEYSMNFYATTKGAVPGLLLETLSDTSAVSWMKEDGTLDETKIKEFLEQANRIYQAQLEALSAYFEAYGVNRSDMEAAYSNVSRQDYPVSAGVSSVGSMELLSYGGLYSPDELFMLTSVQKKRPELVYKAFDGQAQNCFFPESLVGISAKAEEKEAAELFVEFLFSEDAQSTGKNTGFPVKQSAYESPEYWDMGKEGELLQTGMTGDNAVTETDAIKTLNTEIMAGNGPDVMVLDGLPDSTYVERGMLTDISGIIKEAGLLENIKSAYEEEDGSIYRMPARFAMPLIFGKEEDLEKVTDLTTLADVVESHKAEYSMNFYATTKGAVPGLLLENLSDTSAVSWMKEDGTLDETKIKEFLEQANRIYQAQLEAISAYFEAYGVNRSDMEAAYSNVSRQDYPVSAGTSSVGSMELLSYGGLYSPDELFMLTSVQKKRPELVYKAFDGQAQNCFFPESLVGISAKAEEKEAAELFVEFLFSEDAQSTGKNTGFPVKQSSYESPEYWDMGKEGELVSIMSWSDSSGEGGEELEIVNSSDEQLKEMQELGKTLTTPAFDNRIILNAVKDAGSRYLNGETDLDTAVREAVSQVNLYLSE